MASQGSCGTPGCALDKWHAGPCTTELVCGPRTPRRGRDAAVVTPAVEAPAVDDTSENFETAGETSQNSAAASAAAVAAVAAAAASTTSAAAASATSTAAASRPRRGSKAISPAAPQFHMDKLLISTRGKILMLVEGGRARGAGVRALAGLCARALAGLCARALAGLCARALAALCAPVRARESPCANGSFASQTDAEVLRLEREPGKIFARPLDRPMTAKDVDESTPLLEAIELHAEGSRALSLSQHSTMENEPEYVEAALSPTAWERRG